MFQTVVAVGCWGGLMFWAAGTLSWTRAWIHLGTWAATFIANFFILFFANPAVLFARLKRQRTEKKLDILLLTAVLPVTLAIPVTAGLDAVRMQWSSLPAWLIYPGFALHFIGNALVLWAMVVNPYLEKTVRIQTERGHRVITTGPYAIVRHPMYLGVMVMLGAVPLFVGSLWTYVPLGLMWLLLVLRTSFEDRMLRNELPGYKEYTLVTRYRILPGIW